MTTLVATTPIRSRAWQLSGCCGCLWKAGQTEDFFSWQQHHNPQTEDDRSETRLAIFHQAKLSWEQSPTGQPCTLIHQQESSPFNGFSSLWGGTFPASCSQTTQALFSTVTMMLFCSQIKGRVKMWVLVQQLCDTCFYHHYILQAWPLSRTLATGLHRDKV